MAVPLRRRTLTPCGTRLWAAGRARATSRRWRPFSPPFPRYRRDIGVRYLWVLIRITFIRIRIKLFPVMRIRIRIWPVCDDQLCSSLVVQYFILSRYIYGRVHYWEFGGGGGEATDVCNTMVKRPSMSIMSSTYRNLNIFSLLGWYRYLLLYRTYQCSGSITFFIRIWILGSVHWIRIRILLFFCLLSRCQQSIFLFVCLFLAVKDKISLTSHITV